MMNSQKLRESENSPLSKEANLLIRAVEHDASSDKVEVPDPTLGLSIPEAKRLMRSALLDIDHLNELILSSAFTAGYCQERLMLSKETRTEQANKLKAIIKKSNSFQSDDEWPSAFARPADPEYSVRFDEERISELLAEKLASEAELANVREKEKERIRKLEEERAANSAAIWNCHVCKMGNQTNGKCCSCNTVANKENQKKIESAQKSNSSTTRRKSGIEDGVKELSAPVTRSVLFSAPPASRVSAGVGEALRNNGKQEGITSEQLVARINKILAMLKDSARIEALESIKPVMFQGVKYSYKDMVATLYRYIEGYLEHIGKKHEASLSASGKLVVSTDTLKEILSLLEVGDHHSLARLHAKLLKIKSIDFESFLNSTTRAAISQDMRDCAQVMREGSDDVRVIANELASLREDLSSNIQRAHRANGDGVRREAPEFYFAQKITASCSVESQNHCKSNSIAKQAGSVAHSGHFSEKLSHSESKELKAEPQENCRICTIS